MNLVDILIYDFLPAYKLMEARLQSNYTFSRLLTISHFLTTFDNLKIPGQIYFLRLLLPNLFSLPICVGRRRGSMRLWWGSGRAVRISLASTLTSFSPTQGSLDT